jgi:ATP-dependent Lon protease
MPRRTKLQALPILPLKHGVLFPTIMMPMAVGRPASLATFEKAMQGEEKRLVVLAQKDPSEDDPVEEGLHRIGTLAVVARTSRTTEGRLDAVLLGAERVRLERITQKRPCLVGTFSRLPLPSDGSPKIEANRREIMELASRVLSLSGSVNPEEAAQLFASAEEPVRLVYLLAAMALADPVRAQEVLEAPDLGTAMRLVRDGLSREIQVLQVRKDVARHAQTEINKDQREYFLRQQLKAIQEELGEKSPELADLEILKKRLEEALLPEGADREVRREMGRLAQLPPVAAEYSVLRSYVEFALELPWNTLSQEKLDISQARLILDQDHYGLQDVKARILEHLGVLKLNPSAKAPILCFVGAPGVGKTSLGQSIARALGRKFERQSLGGLHDEAELRGHRRTYVGALPGRILQAIRRAGTRNPVLMLDEVDKMGQDFRGDPAAALLEVLDPEQNSSFRDNFLDLPFDLSRVTFITTANTTDRIPPALLDRMEVLRLPGYSNEEKKAIAERYLFPRQLEQAGLGPERCRLALGVLETMISRYTREAGVRELERCIGRALRKVGLRFAEDAGLGPVTVGLGDLSELLGAPPFFEENLRKELTPGVAPGMAWTEAGGDILYVECALLPGSRGLTLTGQLGGVMQESARAAYTWVWGRTEELGIAKGTLRQAGVHVHVPAGAVPKDGPSAGITMAAAIASLFAGRPVRSDTAMTGEITLSGLVLPVGGIKEKVLAAHRAGLRRILLPKENEKDLKEIPQAVRDSLEFVLVQRVEQGLEAVGLKLVEANANQRERSLAGH